MKQKILMAVLGLAVAVPGFAQMGGGMGGGGGHHGGGDGGSGGGGMGGGDMGGGFAGAGIVVADDSSVLLASGFGSTAWEDDGAAAELVNIDADGQERWSASFDHGRPMRPQTANDLVVVTLVEPEDPDGERFDPRHGGAGGDGMRHGPSVLVGLDLVSGVELWTFELDEPTRLRARISPDASRVYVVAADPAQEPSDSWGQGHGDCDGAMGGTLYALDRFGSVLWTHDLGQD